VCAGIIAERLAWTHLQEPATCPLRSGNSALSHQPPRHTNSPPVIGREDDVLVGDLGVACLRDGNGADHFAGTAETMAPEVAIVGATMPPAIWPSQRPTTVLSDVYSLGATLYWIITGTPPFQVAGDAIATMRAVVAGPAPLIRDVAPHVPQALADRVDTAMPRTVASRYQSAAVLDAALGNPPAVLRRWNRLAAHTGHTDCFIGTGHGSDLGVCCVPTGVRTQYRIEIRHAATGWRVNPWPLVPTRRQLPRALRTTFRNHAQLPAEPSMSARRADLPSTTWPTRTRQLSHAHSHSGPY
jgi:eukaryotic-like serine/threonine-protein kinase